MRFVMSLKKYRLLALACVFFFLCKALWVLLPIQAMGLPRLGDDSLVYLWTGSSTVLDPKLESPAVRDIIALRQLDDGNDATLDFLRARTTMRMTYVAASPFAMLTGLLLEFGLSHKVAFAGAELIVAFVLAAGISTLGSALFGPAAAAVALITLSVALLPLQGLHYLIPGVLALALASLLLAEICRPRPRGLVLGMITLMLGLTHTIGVVYIALALAFALLLPMVRQRALVVSWATLTPVLLASILAFAFIKLTGGQSPATSGTGTLSLVDIPKNLGAAMGYVGQSIYSQPVTWALGCLGILFAARARRVEPFVLLFLLLALFLVASLFDINGYPGDLNARVLVPIMIVLACAGGYALTRARRVGISLFAVGVLLLGGQTIFQAQATWLLLIDNMNSRAEIYDEDAIRDDLAALPADASILWTEPDISMMAAFLEGATRFHALPYPMIERSPERDLLIMNASPGYIAAPIPKALNTSARAGSANFSPRRYGVSFADFKSLQIQMRGTVSEQIYLRFSHAPEQNVRLSAQDSSDICKLSVGRIRVFQGNSWLPVDLSGCSPQMVLSVASDSHDIALLGLSFQTPSPRVNWPWGSTALVTAEARTGANAAFALDWTSLIGSSLAQDTNPRVLSDESGIVWLKTDMIPRLRRPDTSRPTASTLLFTGDDA